MNTWFQPWDLHDAMTTIVLVHEHVHVIQEKNMDKMWLLYYITNVYTMNVLIMPEWWLGVHDVNVQLLNSCRCHLSKPQTNNKCPSYFLPTSITNFKSGPLACNIQDLYSKPSPYDMYLLSYIQVPATVTLWSHTEQ